MGLIQLSISTHLKKKIPFLVDIKVKNKAFLWKIKFHEEPSIFNKMIVRCPISSWTPQIRTKRKTNVQKNVEKTRFFHAFFCVFPTENRKFCPWPNRDILVLPITNVQKSCVFFVLFLAFFSFWFVEMKKKKGVLRCGPYYGCRSSIPQVYRAKSLPKIGGGLQPRTTRFYFLTLKLALVHQLRLNWCTKASLSIQRSIS